MMPGLKTVQVRLELINFWGLCLLWVLVNPDELARDAPPAPLRGSPCLQRSRPGTPSQAMQPPPPPPPGTPPKLPAKFSQDPPPGVVASSGAAASSAAKPEPMRPKTPPKNLPAKKPPGRTTTRLTEAALSQLKGSVGKVIQPKTPSPKRAVEEMLPPFRGSCLPEVSQCTPSSFPLLDGVYAFPKVLSLFDSQVYSFLLPFVGWCVRLPEGCTPSRFPLLDGVSAFPRVLSRFVSHCAPYRFPWMVCPPSRGSCLNLSPFLFPFVGWCVRLSEGLASPCLPF